MFFTVCAPTRARSPGLADPVFDGRQQAHGPAPALVVHSECGGVRRVLQVAEELANHHGAQHALHSNIMRQVQPGWRACQRLRSSKKHKKAVDQVPVHKQA